MKKHVLIILMLTAILLIFSCKKEEDTTETIFAVNTTNVLKGQIKDYIELNGDVKAVTEVSVFPDISFGKLSGIANDIAVGKYVYKGQTIAYIDPSKPGMTYAQSPVVAPISGTITDLPVEIGLTVSQQSTIAKIGKLDNLEIVTYIAEKFISKIYLDQKAVLNFDAYPGEKFSATLTEMSPVLDPQTRMMEIKLSIDDTRDKIKPGMFCNLKLIIEEKENIMKIPAECIVERYGEKFVFIIGDATDDRYKKYEEPVLEEDASDDALAKKRKIHLAYKRNVVPGIIIDEVAEVMEGLKEGEEIVLRGQNLLSDKTPVRIINTYQPLSKEDVVE